MEARTSQYFTTRTNLKYLLHNIFANIEIEENVTAFSFSFEGFLQDSKLRFHGESSHGYSPFCQQKTCCIHRTRIKLMFTERFCVFVNLAVGGLESGPDRRIPDGLQNNQCRRFDGFLTVTVIKHDIFFHGPQNKRK